MRQEPATWLCTMPEKGEECDVPSNLPADLLPHTCCRLCETHRDVPDYRPLLTQRVLTVAKGLTPLNILNMLTWNENGLSLSVITRETVFVSNENLTGTELLPSLSRCDT